MEKTAGAGWPTQSHPRLAKQRQMPSKQGDRRAA